MKPGRHEKRRRRSRIHLRLRPDELAEIDNLTTAWFFTLRRPQVGNREFAPTTTMFRLHVVSQARAGLSTARQAPAPRPKWWPRLVQIFLRHERPIKDESIAHVIFCRRSLRRS